MYHEDSTHFYRSSILTYGFQHIMQLQRRNLFHQYGQAIRRVRSRVWDDEYWWSPVQLDIASSCPDSWYSSALQMSTKSSSGLTSDVVHHFCHIYTNTSVWTSQKIKSRRFKWEWHAFVERSPRSVALGMSESDEFNHNQRRHLECWTLNSTEYSFS